MRIGPLEMALLMALVAVVFWVLYQRRARRPVHLELSELFGESAVDGPGPVARRWALGVLYEAGVDADADRPYAVQVLRKAQPRLSASAARALVDAVA